MPNIEARTALCQLIGKWSMLSTGSPDELMDWKELEERNVNYARVNRRVEKTVQQFLRAPCAAYPLRRLEQNEQILSLIETMYTWISQIHQQYQAQAALSPDERVRQQAQQALDRQLGA